MQDKGKRCILDIEAQARFYALSIVLAVISPVLKGVRQVKQTDLNPVYLFIAPPSIQELRLRLTGRGSEKEEAVNARLAMAMEEIKYAQTGAHDFVVKNDDLDQAYAKFETVALGGEIKSDELPELESSKDDETTTTSPPTSGSTQESLSSDATNDISPTSVSSVQTDSKQNCSS